ncbi:dynamin family protein [Cohnella phaseoli]|uniref:Dynamin family protein n=1 Tax=Cohnella phaseoli TaxID=456490 RepID=A0A3D9JTE8_9BACL|nr:dynamin family protein [Cohnella phaseoli]RED77391.1 dynamin family protein [Cohnella phaseoli]
MKAIDLDAPPSGAPLSAELIQFQEALRQMSVRSAANGDEVQAAKLQELAGKLEGGRLTVAFCGHFSAGKSTLVNTLCGATLLPASPIPTSANVVTVVNGEPFAETEFRDSKGNIHPARTIAVEQLHGFAVDGEGVTSIRVSYPIPLLGDRMAIVDTPGVDSTDGAHRAATESALHMADVVFFVTDYNHVQSEVNFRFLRSLARWGKPTYLIVNQIDKHREEQLSFAEFRDSLREALANWDIEPAATLFLSLREPDHPLSQWSQLLELMEQLQPLADPLILRSVTRSAVYLAEQYRETLHERNQEKRQQLQEQLGEDGETERRAALRAEWEAELAQLRSAGDLRKERVRVEMDRLLGNANLTPAETREKAQAVLAAMQPGFKAGWLAGAAKTEAERNARLGRLTDDFNRQVSANVTGHLKELLRREAEQSGLAGEELERSLDDIFRPVQPEWLRSLVKPGAGSEGQATLHYSAEISTELKSLYRKAAFQWIDELQERERPALEEQTKEVGAKLSKLAEADRIAGRIDELEREEREEERQLLAMLPEDGSNSGLRLPAPVGISSDRLEELASEAAAGLNTAGDPDGSAEASDDLPFEEQPEVADAQPTRLGAPQGAAEMLERSAALLGNIAALRGVADGLYAKAARFRDKSFTIALFGAFSAGKSSFANALVGKPALPVSPNPTTATINRIVAPTEEHPDGTALVTMKTPEEFAEDIRHSLGRIGIAKEKLEAAGADVAKLLALKDPVAAADLHPRGRPHLAFLTAAAKGWGEFGSLLGQKLTAGGEEYRRFAADEQASCFVASIDLYVDSPITRSGAVLVDTPGADSINARHTGVAFQYIKNADAVLFVTYYNHAFTEADREFLNQLGSVKDVFELDKMFFVINAADLASSDTELEAVKEHVGNQLLKHGIRKPRLFGVSSLNGLQAKQSRSRAALEASGLAEFEGAFRRFSEEELGGLALASANKELDRVDKLLDSWLQSANADAATREAKAKRLTAQAERWRAEGGDSVPAAAVQPLSQEVGEQLYHLRQRLKFRFKEHFQTAFHPSILQDDGRDLKKLLQSCGEDLKRSLTEDLLQELRAAGLRLEGTIGALADKTLGSLSGLAEMEREGFAPEPAGKPALELPLPEPFAAGPNFEVRQLWNAFRSPKHFFEQEGAAELRSDLEGTLLGTIDEVLEALKRQWEQSTEQALQQTVRAAALAWSEQLAAFALSMSEALRQPGEERYLQDLREQWQKIRQ